jgi:hypothetical protein
VRAVPRHERTLRAPPRVTSNGGRTRKAARGVQSVVSTQLRLLVRLFCRRFLDNDLISPGGERQASAAMTLALLVVPGIFHLSWVFFAYSNPFLTPSERLLRSLDHKTQFITCSMLAVALGAVIEWDALSIDARDMAILGPLPIRSRTLWQAKALALVVFAGTLALAVNVVPTILFPTIWLMLVPIGVVRALSVVAVHGFASVAAALFGFSVVLGLRSLLVLICGPRLFRVVTPFVQFALVLALASAFFLLPRYSCDAFVRLREKGPTLAALPPMWFVGAYDRLTSRRLYDDPDLTRDNVWRFWERERIVRTYRLLMIPGRLPEAWVHPTPLFREELEARKEYFALQPLLDGYARIGFVALPASVATAAALYALACLAYGRRMAEGFTPRRRLPRCTRAVEQIVGRMAGGQVARGVFFFTLKGLARSGSHRFYVATSLAAGCSLILGGALTAAARWSDLYTPSPVLLSLQLVAAFAAVAGLRAAVSLPAHLPANWLFRLTCGTRAREVVAGTGRAIACAVLVVLLVCFLPAQTALWGWRPALLHFIAGVVLSLLLIDILLVGYRKVPLTSPVTAGSSQLAVRLPLYLAAFALFTSGVAWVEYVSSARSWTYVLFIVIVTFAVAFAALARRRSLSARPDVVFDEGPDAAVQTLRLSE